MRSRVGFKVLNGKEVLVFNLSGLEGKELEELVLFSRVELTKIKKETFFLLDATNAKLTNEMIGHILDVAKDIQPYVVRSAFTGINGLRRALFSIYVNFTGSKAKIFKTKKECVDYLTT